MDIKPTVNKLIHIPSDMRGGNNSFYSLLESTGYFDKYEKVSINDINLALNTSPSCILDWLAWSEDKRTSSGWYFTGNDEKGYVVGFATEDGYSSQEELYTKADIACSNYIKRETEEIRMRHKSSPKDC